MGNGRWLVMDRAWARASLRLFLPISGAITLVLVPMAALYEQARRTTLETRISALVRAGSALVRDKLEDITDDTALTALQIGRNPSHSQPQELRDLLGSALQAYERYQLMAVYDRQGRPLVRVTDGPVPPLDPAALQQAVQQGLRLQRQQLWLSPVLWPASSSPMLLAVRPLFAAGSGQRLGVLLALASLKPLAGEFDQSANATPELQRGYLISGSGKLLNRTGGLSPGESFAARYPAVWQQMQRRPTGVVNTDGGLFLYFADQVVPAVPTRRDGLFVFDRGDRQSRLGVVIQVPSASLYRTSAFNQPAGLSLLALLYLLAAAASGGIAGYQRHLAVARAEERLAQERLQALLASSGVGMAMVDPASGRLLSANAAFCALLRRTEEELRACSWQQITHPDDLAADQALLEELLSGRRDQYRLRKRYLRPDGSLVWVDLVVSCTRDSNGQVRDLIGQANDVSELISQASYLEAAASAGVVGVWDWDVERNVLTFDRVMYQLYGLRPVDFANTREAWEQAVHPDDKPLMLQELQAAVKGWREYQPRFRVVWPDGTIRHLQARSRTTYGPDGTALRMIGVNYDITEQAARELEVEQQRKLLATTLDALVDPLLFLSLEAGASAAPPQLRIAELNPAAAAFFRRSQAQLVGEALAQLLPGDGNGALLAALVAVAQGEAPLLQAGQPLQLRPDGPERFVDLQAVAVPDGLVFSFRDVSEQREAVLSLAASEERFRLLAQNVTDVVFLSEAGRISWISPGLQEALGWPATDWVGSGLAAYSHPEDQALVAAELEQAEAGAVRRFRLRARDRQEQWHWLEVHAGPNRNGQGVLQGVVGAFRVVDLEVAAEQELDRRARTDPLTGLINRQEILEHLHQLTRHRRHQDEGVAVLFCDIDHFKAINDTHGHSGGDAVLLALAERLRRCTRQEDLVGRIGGDELLVVLKGISSLAAAEAIAAKIHQAAQEPLWLASGEVRPSLSIGVSLIQPGETVEAALERADQAMYGAKQQGRNRVIAFA